MRRSIAGQAPDRRQHLGVGTQAGLGTETYAQSRRSALCFVWGMYVKYGVTPVAYPSCNSCLRILDLLRTDQRRTSKNTSWMWMGCASGVRLIMVHSSVALVPDENNTCSTRAPDSAKFHDAQCLHMQGTRLCKTRKVCVLISSSACFSIGCSSNTCFGVRKVT